MTDVFVVKREDVTPVVTELKDIPEYTFFYASVPRYFKDTRLFYKGFSAASTVAVGEGGHTWEHPHSPFENVRLVKTARIEVEVE
jgi:hypothetical protein